MRDGFPTSNYLMNEAVVGEGDRYMCSKFEIHIHYFLTAFEVALRAYFFTKSYDLTRISR